LKAEIKPGDHVDGQWQKYTVSIPLTPVTTIITVDAYDAVAEKTSGWTPSGAISSIPRPASPPLIPQRRAADFQVWNAADGEQLRRRRLCDGQLYGQTSQKNSFNYSLEFEAKIGAGAAA
jgi:hypothetical protein